MIGKGPLKSYAVNLAKKLSIQNSLRVIDYVEKLNRYYVSSDIFVMTSYNDSFGLVAAEAMACGKPVIVSNRGAPIEVIGKAGYTFKYACHNELAEKIIFLLENEEIRIKMGKKAQERIVNNFSWEKAAKKYLKIYKNILCT